MALYLDTNALVGRAGLGSLELNTLLGLCSEAGVDVVLPSIVADEVESQRRRILEAAFDNLVAAHREASRLAPVPALSELPNPGELAREHGRQLREQVTVAPTPADAPSEALRRETFRLTPARDGAGARDTAIWLTIRADHLSRDEVGYFVTNNSRDFAAPGSPSTLHPRLVSELAAHAQELILCPKPTDAIELLATPSQPFVDGAEVAALASVRRATLRLLLDATFMSALAPPPELTGSRDARLFASGPASLLHVDVLQINGYEVGGRRLAVVRLSWELAFELGTLEKAAQGRVQRTIPVRCSAQALAWVVQDQGGAHGCEIAHVSKVSAEPV